MSAHTPGPWTADIRVGCAVVYQGEGSGGCIDNGRKRLAYFAGCRIEVDGKFDHWDVSPEDIANAHLIAAAPELLEALNDLVDCISETRRTSAHDALERAFAAIAKAEGRT
jgi:hypothetical protein